MKPLIPALAIAALLSACSRNETPRPEAATPAPAPAEAAPSPATTAAATATLAPTQGHTANGTLTLAPMGDAVHISGTLQGLPPNAELGFHIHEKGDCSAPDASSAGAHFNPGNAPHGNPAGGEHHAGDMLNAKSDAQGVARVEAHASGVSLGGGQMNDVAGKAIVLHAKPDDYATQPSGNSGDRIACGVIAGGAG